MSERLDALEESQSRIERIVARQHLALEGYAQTLLAHGEMIAKHNQIFADHAQMLADFDDLIVRQREAVEIDKQRIDRLSLAVAELADKLNGVIGFLDSRGH